MDRENFPDEFLPERYPLIKIYSWADGIAELEQTKYDKIITPIQLLPDPEIDPKFINSKYSIQLGATETFREDRRGRHLQVRTYRKKGFYLLEMDDFNPDKGEKLSHAFRDVGHYSIPATIIAGYSLIQKINN